MEKLQLNVGDRVVITLLACAALIGLAYVMFGWAAIGLVLKSEVTAAWLQAIGSLIALGLAIWMPLRMRELELADRKRLDRDLASVRAVKVSFKLRPLEGFAAMFLDELSAHEKHGTDIDFDGLREFFSFIEVPDDEDVLAVHRVSVAAGIRLSMVMGCVVAVQTALRGTAALKDPGAATSVGLVQKFLIETIVKEIPQVIDELNEFGSDQMAAASKAG